MTKCSKFTLFSKIGPKFTLFSKIGSKFILAFCSKIGPKISKILSMVDGLTIRVHILKPGTHAYIEQFDFQFGRGFFGAHFSLDPPFGVFLGLIAEWSDNMKSDLTR